MIRRGRDFIQLPGPTNVPERVLRAMMRAGEDFAAPAFTKFARKTLDDLKPVFQTEGEVYAYSALGHAAWEIAFANLVGQGDRVLIAEQGRFAAVWRDVGQALALEVDTLEGDWRRPVDPDRVEERLRADRAHGIKAVLAVHVETSTGIANDLALIRRAIDDAGHPALLIVDAIASLAVQDLPMDALGADVVLAASQKGLMLPPGLAFVAVGPKAKAVSADGGAPRRYWDWRPRAGEEAYMWFYGTPPVQMIHGLRASLDMIQEEGLADVFARHRRLAEAARAAVARWSEGGGLDFYAIEPPSRSDSVTAIRFEQGVDAEALRRHARDRYGVAFGGGLGPLNGRVLRIGHLGDLNEPMILGALAVLEAAMRDLGVMHRPDGVTAAIESLTLSP